VIKLDKYQLLKNEIIQMDKVIVAFSGGVDSTFLLKVAFDVLGYENVLAVTANSRIRFKENILRAKTLADMIGAKQIIIETRELENDLFVKNDELRCYYCKYELFKELREISRRNDIKNIIDGTNYDDFIKDYRPGLKALNEFKISSPLKDCEFKKQEIRHLSRILNLPTWNRASDTCLVTRLAYNIKIEKNILEKIKKAEAILSIYKFKRLRARLHDPYTIRIEVFPEDMDYILNKREEICEKIKKIGFNYITLDLQGYRSGSMNELMKGDRI
jgi:pyridinium-3,5-biscarboxylic acid mononucleotide sulfurtransferase